MSDPPRPPPANTTGPVRQFPNEPFRWPFAVIAIFAGLAFGLSFLLTPANAVIGVLGMGFSAIVFTVALVGSILVDIKTDLQLLTERRRQRQEAEWRGQAAEWERRNREPVDAEVLRTDPDAMQITQEQVTAQRDADRRQRGEIRRGTWARFWNGVNKRIARMLGEENEILIGLVFGVVKALICLAPFWALAAAGIVAWTLL